MNLFLGVVLLMKGNYIKFRFKKKATEVILWIFMGLFVMNTVANLFAETNFEKLFAVLTFVFAFLIRLILKTKEPGNIMANKGNSNEVAICMAIHTRH